MSLKYAIIGLVVAAAAIAGATMWIINSGKEPEQRVSLTYPEGVAAVVPLGLSVGEAPAITASTANPLASVQTAVAEGKKLFGALNCAGCHGYDAAGGMGPDLTDTEWRYGGTPIDIYKSIYEGRPQGMPAWGNALPPQSIWQLVAYLQSLGGSFPTASPGLTQPAVGAGQGQGASAGQSP